MAPKKRTSSGNVKTAFKKVRELTPQTGMTSIKGKVMTKTGKMTSRADCPWAWVEVKDETDGSIVRCKAFGGEPTKALSECNFLKTYDFCGFKPKPSEYGPKVELVWNKGGSVVDSEVQLDESDEWDQLEYAPLSDIGQTGDVKRNFIAKMIDEGETVDDMVAVKFKDEENVEKTIKVHVSYKDILVADRVFVIHRAHLSPDGATVDAYSMLTPAPRSYVWA